MKNRPSAVEATACAAALFQGRLINTSKVMLMMLRAQFKRLKCATTCTDPDQQEASDHSNDSSEFFPTGSSASRRPGAADGQPRQRDERTIARVERLMARVEDRGVFAVEGQT